VASTPRCARTPATNVGMSCGAASNAPAAKPTITDVVGAAREPPVFPATIAYAAASAPVAAHVTGSPHRPCSANAMATAIGDASIALARRSGEAAEAAITHGSSATDHERFGVLSIETRGPDSAKMHA